MLRRATILLAFLGLAFVAGCDDSKDKKPYPTSGASPAIPAPPDGKAPGVN